MFQVQHIRFFQSLIDTLGEEEAKEYVKNLAEQVGEVTVNGYIPNRTCCER